MTKTTLTYILLLTSLTAFSERPANPYHFNAPNFDNILPFSKTELQTFKDKGINKVEISSADLRTIYYLNDQGQLTSDEQIWIKKKKEIIVNTTKYKYNDNGLLTVRHTTGKWDIFYDSLAYDDKGRVTHYYTYRKLLTGKKKYQVKDVRYNLELLSSDDNKVILVDSSYNYVKRYTLDNDNQVQLIHSPNQTDSVSIESNGDLEYTKKYWYKADKDTVFRVGQEFTYKNGLIQTKTLWDKIWEGTIVVYKTYYTYDQLNRLLRTENENKYQRKVFYTYYDFGLPMEQITINMNLTTIMKFRYWFT